MKDIDLYHHIKQLEANPELQKDIDPRVQNISLEFIPFEDLYVTRSQVEKFEADHVLDIMEEYHPAIMRPSSIARIDGVNILWEGQHSATVNYLKGFNKVPCVVYTCDDLSFKNTPSVEKFDAHQMAMVIEMFMEDTGAETLEDVLKLVKPIDDLE